MQVPDITSTPLPLSPTRTSPARQDGFSDLFLRTLGETNRLQANVESLVERAALGEAINPATMASAVNKADLAFRTLVQMRNKLVQAFDELRQMQV